MTKEEILSMAKKAGSIPIHKDYKKHVLVGNDVIERFAALVAVKEREECAKAAEDFLTSGRSPLGRSVAAAIRARGEGK